MATLVLCVVLSLCFVATCSAAKLAMIPMFSGSHYHVMGKLGDELRGRGHEVVIFVGDSEKPAQQNKPHIRVFKLGEDLKTTIMTFKPFNHEKGFQVRLEMMFKLADVQNRYCSVLLDNKHLMAELKDADVIIGDSVYPCASMIAAKYSIPHVAILMSVLATPTFHAYGIPSPPAYAVQVLPGIPGRLNFLQRVQNVFGWMATYLVFHLFFCTPYEGIKVKYNIVPHQSVQETIGTVDLIIAQVEFPLETPRPLLPNTKVVGPLTASPAKPLNTELEEFMQNSGDQGVVLVSFGTVVGTDKTMIDKMAAAFSKLPYKVLWKFQMENSRTQVSDNVKMMSWLPQNDILGHSKVKLFFGHGGVNGMLEAMYHGVPMLIAPFFGDQPLNAKVAKHNGMAEWVSLASVTANELADIMSKVISNSSYKENAVRLSRLIKLKPRLPVSEAADWVEYLIAVGSFSHLRPRELDMPFYQLYLLDVILFLFLLLIAVLWLVRALCGCIVRRVRGSTLKEKTQ